MEDLLILAVVSIVIGIVMAGVSNRTRDRVRQAKESRYSKTNNQILSFSLEHKIRKSS